MLTIMFFQIFRSAKVFEEEDFDPRDYGYVLTPDVVNTKACFMLKEAEDELTKQLKADPDNTDGTEVNRRLKWEMCQFLFDKFILSTIEEINKFRPMSGFCYQKLVLYNNSFDGYLCRKILINWPIEKN